MLLTIELHIEYFAIIIWIQDTKYGVWKEGVKYIHNTYEAWQKQFDWLTTMTIKRIFKKLVELKIFIQEKYGKGYSHEQMWRIDYSHPLVTKCNPSQKQNVTASSNKMLPRYNTDTYPNKTTDTTPVVKTEIPTDRRTYQKTKQRTAKELARTTPENYKEAKAWLVGLDIIDRDRIEKYIKAQADQPKVRNPIGLERYVTCQVWLKHMGKENHCDFEVSMDLRPKKIPVLQVTYKEPYGTGFDEEMQELMSRGGME